MDEKYALLFCNFCNKYNYIVKLLVTAWLGLYPNKGLVIILTKAFLVEPSVFQEVYLHIIMLGVQYKFVELICSSQDLYSSEPSSMIILFTIQTSVALLGPLRG